MLRFINWNSSPVFGVVVFQYISCYGLSDYAQDEIIDSIGFQYISCYGLSSRA